MVHAVHPAGAAARTMAIGRGLRHLRMALWDAGGVSPAAAGGNFAGCGQRPKALSLDSAIWAARRPLARVVGEEFCVRPRCGFAGILDVWQEVTPQAWRKRPGEHRRHTGGGQPSQEKNQVKLFNFRLLRALRRKKTGHAANHYSAPGGGITKIIDEWPYRFYRRYRPVPYPAG